MYSLKVSTHALKEVYQLQEKRKKNLAHTKSVDKTLKIMFKF